jgi:hypothetical protein
MATKLKLAALALVCLGGAGLVFAQPAKNSPSDPSRGNYRSAVLEYYSRGQSAPQGRPDPDQRLADMEKRLEGLLADVKALRKDLSKSGAGSTVIPLRKADAVLAGKMLDAVFEGRTGVTLTIDGRTNSIIIQGGEKDLKEARRIIEVLEEGKPAQEPGPKTPGGLGERY